MNASASLALFHFGIYCNGDLAFLCLAAFGAVLFTLALYLRGANHKA